MTNNELPLAVLKFNTPLNCALMVFAAFSAVRKLFVELLKTGAKLLRTGAELLRTGAELLRKGAELLRTFLVHSMRRYIAAGMPS